MIVKATQGVQKDNYLSKNGDGDIISKYIENITTMSVSTAYEYLTRLNIFKAFISNEFDLTLSSLINKIKEGVYDPYDVLSAYSSFLRRNSSISTPTLKQRVVTVKNFLEYCDVDISPRKFKLKVKLPKVIRKSKEALSKEDIIDILNVCSDIRLKTYVMLLATTGMRAVEALSVRIKDIDLKSTNHPAKVFVRGEYTKTRTDRTIFLTEEIK